MHRRVLIVVMITGALTVLAQAAGTPRERDACTPDAFRFCTAVFPFEGSVYECLKANLPRLSHDCRDVIASSIHTRRK